MFTGLVETIGVVSSLEEYDEYSDSGTTLTISEAEEILTDVRLGDSICINGACLTVTEFTSQSFKVGVAPETLRRTNLGSLQQGDKVNLERAVSVGSRLGHYVQGHVDTIATILSVTSDNGKALILRLRPRDFSVLKYIVEKGYVAIDGASLTVTAVVDGPEGWWEVMLIQYTQGKIVTAAKKAGDEVNIEVDCIGRNVEKSVAAYFEEKISGNTTVLEKMVNRIVESKLRTRVISE
jgi:riboflavin synthase